MAGKTKRAAERAIEQERHHKAMSNEVRVDILTYLINHSTGSPSSIAKETGHAVQTVDRHMKQLVRYGAAELVDIRPTTSGPPEHIYRAIMRPILDDTSWLSLPARHVLARQCLEAILGDVAEAADEDLFAKRSDWLLARTPLLLDSEGIEELQQLHCRLVEDALQVEALSNGRRAKSMEKGRRVSTCQLCFLLPEPSGE